MYSLFCIYRFIPCISCIFCHSLNVAVSSNLLSWDIWASSLFLPLYFYVFIDERTEEKIYIYKLEIILARQKKQRKEEQTRVPRSLFDRPTAQLLKIRREHKQKSGLLKPFRPVPPPIVKPNADTSDHPEWLIHEDWALLQVIHIYLQTNIGGGILYSCTLSFKLFKDTWKLLNGLIC